MGYQWKVELHSMVSELEMRVKVIEDDESEFSWRIDSISPIHLDTKYPCFVLVLKKKRLGV